MCGLIGVGRFGKSGLTQALSDAFKNLLIADSVRGSDGTGLFCVNTKGRRFSLKAAGDPYSLMYDKNFESYVSANTHPWISIIAGHNRLATTGKITNAHSHPFYHKSITLMHNGTLTDYSKLPVPIVNNKPVKFDVDSDALCYSISEQGLATTVKNFDGAYAIVYYDSSQKTLNFARNSQRPLFIGMSEKEGELIWGSELGLLKWMAERHKLPVDLVFGELPANRLHSFSIPSGDLKETELPFTGSELSKRTYNDEEYPPFWNYSQDARPQFPLSLPDPKKETTIVPFAPKKGKEVSEVKLLVSKPNPKTQAVTSYKAGEHVSFYAYEAIPIDVPNERYHLIGHLDEFSQDVEIRANIVGAEKVNVFLDQGLLRGKIQHMVEVNHPGKVKRILVWLVGVDLPESLNSTAMAH